MKNKKHIHGRQYIKRPAGCAKNTENKLGAQQRQTVTWSVIVAFISPGTAARTLLCVPPCIHNPSLTPSHRWLTHSHVLKRRTLSQAGFLTLTSRCFRTLLSEEKRSRSELQSVLLELYPHISRSHAWCTLLFHVTASPAPWKKTLGRWHTIWNMIYIYMYIYIYIYIYIMQDVTHGNVHLDVWLLDQSTSSLYWQVNWSALLP